MKRYIAILTMALVAVSCMRGDYLDEPDIVGGRSVINNQEARTYMMYIADNLVTDVLDELELALNISERGMEKSAHFTFDKRLTTVGATWTVKADDSHLNGLTLHCDAADTWSFTFSGDYVFGSEENEYPTTFSMKAVKYVPEDEADTTLGWVVSLSGERKEWKDNKKQNSSVKKYVITGMSPDGYVWDDPDEGISIEEMKSKMADRQLYLASIKKQQEEYQNSRSAAKPAAATAGKYDF